MAEQIEAFFERALRGWIVTAVDLRVAKLPQRLRELPLEVAVFALAEAGLVMTGTYAPMDGYTGTLFAGSTIPLLLRMLVGGECMVASGGLEDTLALQPVGTPHSSG
jgi:hypothetical protein